MFLYESFANYADIAYKKNVRIVEQLIELQLSFAQNVEPHKNPKKLMKAKRILQPNLFSVYIL